MSDESEARRSEPPVVVKSFADLDGAYRLSRKIQDDLKRDETVVIGVVACTLFNKSRRKAYVDRVRALDENREEIDVKWAPRIDHLGNPQEPFGLVGVVDSFNLYVRRNDGESIDYMWLEIRHSFPDSPATVEYDANAGWPRWVVGVSSGTSSLERRRLGREYVRLPPRRVVPPQRTDPALRQPPERSMVHGRLVPCVGFHLGTEDRLRGTSPVIGGKRLYLQ